MEYTCKPLPPVHYLRECFSLDIETGALFWKDRPAGHFAKPSSRAAWKRLVGNRADRLNSKGYRRVRLDGRALFAHRVVWALTRNVTEFRLIDHINRIPSDNRPLNLREASHALNSQNRKTQSRFGSGVYIMKSGRFRAHVTEDRGACRYLGTFPTPEQAAAAVSAARAARGFS